jgi:AcrR family transcriptional regulator
MKLPATAASSNDSTPSSLKPMPAEHDPTRIEAACAELAAAGAPITFQEVAARAQISRTTLYRRADLRAVVEQHRALGRDATTLSGLTVQIDQLRRALESLAAKVRHHEETLRRLERARRNPEQ